MPGSHWLVTLTRENYARTRETGHSVLGLRTVHRKKAERMAVGDRVLYYVASDRVFPSTALITSTYFEDRKPIWVDPDGRGDPYPYRVHTRPKVVLEPWEGLDAAALGPRLLYVKRWPLEQWFLALIGDIHLLSSLDFQLVENEMVRVVESRGRRREQPPLHAPPAPAPPRRSGVPRPR